MDKELAKKVMHDAIKNYEIERREILLYLTAEKRGSARWGPTISIPQSLLKFQDSSRYIQIKNALKRCLELDQEIEKIKNSLIKTEIVNSDDCQFCLGTGKQ
jgi:hypothetical protein